MWMCVTHTMYWSWSIVHPFDLVSRTRRVGRRAECDRTAIIGERVRHERKSSLSRIALFIRFFALHCAPPTPPPSLILSLCVPTHQEHRIEKERLVDSVRPPLELLPQGARAPRCSYPDVLITLLLLLRVEQRTHHSSLFLLPVPLFHPYHHPNPYHTTVSYLHGAQRQPPHSAP